MRYINIESLILDNLVNLLVEKINSLSENTRETLKICACIGNRFELELLANLLEKSIDEILHDITEAMNEGIINVTGNLYFFQHDRIQEAVYSLIPQEKRLEIHYSVGKNALEKVSEVELGDTIFYIVDQLNRGKELIQNEEEKIEFR